MTNFICNSRNNTSDTISIIYIFDMKNVRLAAYVLVPHLGPSVTVLSSSLTSVLFLLIYLSCSSINFVVIQNHHYSSLVNVI